jgi:hypothetical protein
MDAMRKFILAAALCTLLPVGVALAQTAAAPKPAAQSDKETGVDRTKPQAKAVVPTTPAPSYLPIKDFMRHVVNPAAEGYWAASGAVDDNNKAPTDDAHWQTEYDHAAAIQEAGNMLLAQGRLINDPVWITNANKLIKGGQDGVKASVAHDSDAGFDAGSTMYDACYDCHAKYVVRAKDSLYDHKLDGDKPDGDTHSLR